jgi:2'-5' RNA ligase
VRLFTAVVPPEREIDRLGRAVEGIRATPGLRWVPPAQWHLTLTFLGELAEPALPGLLERLARAAARTTAFPLRLAGAGTFPRRPVRARVLHVGVDGDVDALRRLAERSTAAARRSGAQVDDRGYRPHLTLARGRGPGADARPALAVLAAYVGEPWQVTAFRLVRSTLGAQVRHDVVAELAFGTGRAG